MTSWVPRRLVPTLSLSVALVAAALVTAPVAAADTAGSTGRAFDAGTCSTTKLSGAKAIRTRSGDKLGTAQVFAASSGGDLGFCVRIKPVKALRRTTTQALLPHATFFPDGDRSSSGLIGGSGAWRHAFLVTGSDFGPGYSMEATARIVVPGGPSGRAKIEGTLP